MDRNNPGRAARPRPDTSLSARRAWIEIYTGIDLRDEQMSLSARRAWIEIWDAQGRTLPAGGRSPQGERG